MLRFGLIYFAVVFGAGFALAPVREFLLAPRLGQMGAELLEMPVMLLVMYLCAGWIARQPKLRNHPSALFGSGIIALGFMVLAELGVVYFVRGVTLGEYIARREPVSGLVYLFMLALFALLPWWRGRTYSRRSP